VTSTGDFGGEIEAGWHAGSRKRMTALPVLPLIVLVAATAAAITFIVYVLWPRWPEPVLGTDAPALPITVAGVGFDVPPAAIRVGVQRHAGAHERIDLAFLWPSLSPAEAAHTPNAAAAAGGVLDRIFVTIAAAGDTLAPAYRIQTIYPRYASSEALPGPPGLAVLPFRDGTPYQGEDLIYDAQAPANFLVRCTRATTTPGTCLFQRRIAAADVVVRFPRDWIADWQTIAGNIDRLIEGLRAP
jgi:hypothetical protein